MSTVYYSTPAREDVFEWVIYLVDLKKALIRLYIKRNNYE